jgi:hypothetical protein
LPGQTPGFFHHQRRLDDVIITQKEIEFCPRAVTGKTLRGSKTTTLGGSNARLIARILLRELAAEGKA